VKNIEQIQGYPSTLNGDNHHIFINDNSKKLVLLFSAKDMKPGKFNFWQIGREIDANLIFLNDTSNQWYQNGVESLGDSLESTIDILQQWIKVLEITEVYTLGTSMGGYGAIHYGTLLDAHILSFAVETILKQDFSQSKKLLKDSTNIKCNDLRTIVNNSTKDIYLFVGESNVLDIWQASLMLDLNSIHIISLIGVDHYVPSYLSRNSKLIGLFNSFIKHGAPNLNTLTNIGRIFDYTEVPKRLYETEHAYRNKDYMNAEKIGKSILENHEYIESALYLVGMSLIKQKKFKEAAQYLSKVCHIAPHNSDYAFYYSHAVRMEGYKEESLHLLNILLINDPKYAKAYYAKGQILASLHELPKAISNIKTAIKIEPKNKSFQAGLERILQKETS